MKKLFEAHLINNKHQYVREFPHSDAGIADFIFKDGKEFIAVEAKGNGPKSELDRSYAQAYSFKNFTHRSYILIPRETLGRMDLNHIREIKVGLLTITKDRLIEIINESEINTDPEASLLLEQFEERTSTSSLLKYERKIGRKERTKKIKKMILSYIQNYGYTTEQELLIKLKLPQSSLRRYLSQKLEKERKIKQAGWKSDKGGRFTKLSRENKIWVLYDCDPNNLNFPFPRIPEGGYSKLILDEIEDKELNKTQIKNKLQENGFSLSESQIEGYLQTMNKKHLIEVTGTVSENNRKTLLYKKREGASISPKRIRGNKKRTENKIIAYLDNFSPLTVSQIAFGVRLTTQAVSVRIQGMVEKGLVVESYIRPGNQHSGKTYTIPNYMEIFRVPLIPLLSEEILFVLLDTKEIYLSLSSLSKKINFSTRRTLTSQLSGLVSRGFVQEKKAGKEKEYLINESGIEYCMSCRIEQTRTDSPFKLRPLLKTNPTKEAIKELFCKKNFSTASEIGEKLRLTESSVLNYFRELLDEEYITKFGQKFDPTSKYGGLRGKVIYCLNPPPDNLEQLIPYPFLPIGGLIDLVNDIVNKDSNDRGMTPSGILKHVHNRLKTTSESIDIDMVQRALLQALKNGLIQCGKRKIKDPVTKRSTNIYFQLDAVPVSYEKTIKEKILEMLEEKRVLSAPELSGLLDYSENYIRNVLFKMEEEFSVVESSIRGSHKTKFYSLPHIASEIPRKRLSLLDETTLTVLSSEGKCSREEVFRRLLVYNFSIEYGTVYNIIKRLKKKEMVEEYEKISLTSKAERYLQGLFGNQTKNTQK